MWQARHIKSLIVERYPMIEVTLSSMTTRGDRLLDSRLDKIGGKGLFVKELEDALFAGTADIAVHSMKDVPMVLPPGLVIAAITQRADARDAFVSNRYDSMSALPPGAVVGTSSLRRESQLKVLYPQLRVEPLRGNVQTRLKKLDAGEFDAIILAAAGLQRLGLADRIKAMLEPEISLPAPGQGALGIECRAENTDVVAVMQSLADAPTTECVLAERALSCALSGNCQLPLAAYAQIEKGVLRLRGVVASRNADRIVRDELSGDPVNAEALGRELAERLKQQGAAEILAELENG